MVVDELRTCGWFDESSDILGDGCILAVEQSLNVREVGVECKVGKRPEM